MNKMQDETVCKVLNLLNEHNRHLLKSMLLDILEKYSNSNDEEIWFVINRLLNNYKLIYKSNSWLYLFFDVKVTINIGLIGICESYIKTSD